MYLFEKLLNALSVFFKKKIEETELYSTSRNRLAFFEFYSELRSGLAL
jgi:hypothetical protein